MKFFGGRASRAEVYGLFLATVVLVGGGIGGAIVVSNNDAIQPSVQAPATSPPDSGGTPPSGMTQSAGVPTTDGGSSPSRPPVSIAGMTDAEAKIVQDLVAGQVEQQRRAAEFQARRAWQAANPAARFDGVKILACTTLGAEAPSPGRVQEKLKFVEYQVDYFAFVELNPSSYINPGLSVYELKLPILNDGWIPITQRNLVREGLETSPGSHSVVRYGLLFEGGGPPMMEVALDDVAQVYGGLSLLLPVPTLPC